jgi:hypothetical protein
MVCLAIPAHETHCSVLTLANIVAITGIVLTLTDFTSWLKAMT